MSLAAERALPETQSHPTTIPSCPALISYLVKHALVGNELVLNTPGSAALVTSIIGSHLPRCHSSCGKSSPTSSSTSSCNACVKLTKTPSMPSISLCDPIEAVHREDVKASKS